ncbi:MAG: hypothetical protein ABIF08_00630 [Nanoarchaeota archaeon]
MIASVIDAISKVLSWFFNPERRKRAYKKEQLSTIKKWEETLASGLKNNESKTIAIARAKLKELRDKYKYLNV